MRPTITLLIWTLVSLGIVASARATTIITPMIEKDSSGSAFRCFAVNTGKKPVTSPWSCVIALATYSEVHRTLSVQPGAASLSEPTMEPSGIASSKANFRRDRCG